MNTEKQLKPKLSETLQVRLDTDSFEELEEISEKQGFKSPSTFVREVIFSKIEEIKKPILKLHPTKPTEASEEKEVAKIEEKPKESIKPKPIQQAEKKEEKPPITWQQSIIQLGIWLAYGLGLAFLVWIFYKIFKPKPKDYSSLYLSPYSSYLSNYSTPYTGSSYGSYSGSYPSTSSYSTNSYSTPTNSTAQQIKNGPGRPRKVL